MRRFRSVPHVGAAVATTLVVVLPIAAIHAFAPTSAIPRAAAPTVTVSPTTVVPGGAVTIKGRIAPKGRKVVLQRSTGGSWTKVTAGKTKRRGAFSFTTTAPRTGSKVLYRATAPKVVIGGKTYAKVTTAASKKVTISATPTATATPTPTSTPTATSTPTSTPTTTPPTTPPTSPPTTPPAATYPQRVAALDETSFDVSSDGRYVVFVSADALVPADVNGVPDVFRLDRSTGQFTLVSVAAGGAQASAASRSPRVSANGRYVVFSTNAKLTATDANSGSDVYRRDVEAGTTSLVSYDSGGQSVPAQVSNAADISDDGRYVAFDSSAPLTTGDENLTSDVFVRDTNDGGLTRLTAGTGGATKGGGSTPVISGDGSTVAYLSASNDLVAGDNNGFQQAYVQARTGGTPTLVSRTSAGAAGNQGTFQVSITTNGQTIAFYSRATNLVANDTNASDDVFVVDRTSGGPTRVSVPLGGAQANGASRFPAISGDGTTISYSSTATDIVPNDTNGVGDVFVQDLATGARELVSKSAAGTLGNGLSRDSVLDAGGDVVLFGSDASNLVADDTNGVRDLFLDVVG